MSETLETTTTSEGAAVPAVVSGWNLPLSSGMKTTLIAAATGLAGLFLGASLAAGSHMDYLPGDMRPGMMHHQFTRMADPGARYELGDGVWRGGNVTDQLGDGVWRGGKATIVLVDAGASSDGATATVASA